VTIIGGTKLPQPRSNLDGRGRAAATKKGAVTKWLRNRCQCKHSRELHLWGSKNACIKCNCGGFDGA